MMTFTQVTQSVDYMTEKLNIVSKALKKSYQASANADHITLTGHNIKLDHFEIQQSAFGYYFRIKSHY